MSHFFFFCFYAVHIVQFYNYSCIVIQFRKRLYFLRLSITEGQITTTMATAKEALTVNTVVCFQEYYYFLYFNSLVCKHFCIILNEFNLLTYIFFSSFLSWKKKLKYYGTKSWTKISSTFVYKMQLSKAIKNRKKKTVVSEFLFASLLILKYNNKQTNGNFLFKWYCFVERRRKKMYLLLKVARLVVEFAIVLYEGFLMHFIIFILHCFMEVEIINQSTETATLSKMNQLKGALSSVSFRMHSEVLKYWYGALSSVSFRMHSEVLKYWYVALSSVSFRMHSEVLKYWYGALSSVSFRMHSVVFE